ncbi:MAG TPA: hydroxyisourate hydrolase [Bryobacteraceae bacterium]|jgi:5-hydroxyisourate hydrolase|nr:hydroxyisourate hydrolase [Bryobacteraceae bacterium]
MSGISTHVLDTAKGQPAQGLLVTLERQSHAADWDLVGEGITDSNGRISQLLRDGEALEAATYRLLFRTVDYFAGQECFYPEVVVLFLVRESSAKYHIPLLLSPYGYTTYRGS